MSKGNAKKIVNHFQELLDIADKERDVQIFLEENPFLLTFGYRPKAGYVVSQLPLGADYRVDFAFVVSLNSGTFLHLVEIESPKIEIFSYSGEFSPAFNHAFQQIEDWTRWCTRNRDYLENTLSDAIGLRAFRETPIPQFHLIAGRRSQLKNRIRKERFVAKANSLNRDISLATYDDLIDSCAFAVYGELDYVDTGVKCMAYRKQNLEPKKG